MARRWDQLMCVVTYIHRGWRDLIGSGDWEKNNRRRRKVRVSLSKVKNEFKSRLLSEAADRSPVFDRVTANILPPRSLSRQRQRYFLLHISDLVGVGTATWPESVREMLDTHNVWGLYIWFSSWMTSARNTKHITLFISCTLFTIKMSIKFSFQEILQNIIPSGRQESSLPK